MFRRCSPMLAPSLLMTNVESRTREPSSERLLPGAGAAHANRVNQGKEVAVC